MLPGHYAGANIVAYLHNVIGVYGPYDASDRCIDRGQVVIDAPGDIAFWAQDHATAFFSCLTISSAFIGLAGRQFTLIDYSDITSATSESL